MLFLSLDRAFSFLSHLAIVNGSLSFSLDFSSTSLHIFVSVSLTLQPGLQPFYLDQKSTQKFEGNKAGGKSSTRGSNRIRKRLAWIARGVAPYTDGISIRRHGIGHLHFGQ